MASPVEKIKERLDIVEVIGNYVKLEKAGSNYKAKCPFHNERTPSFFVSPGRGYYYCFGCGAKGDIFTFVQEFEGLDFLGALKVLAEKAGVVLERQNKDNRNREERFFNCLEEAALFFEEKLSKNDDAKKYLADRGLSKKTISEWRLGFAPDDWHALETYLKNKGFSGEEVFKVGLVKTSIKEDSSGNFYDTFRRRIIFPIFDGAGRAIAFSGRIFNGDENEAKYLNSPETELFKKSEVLYGFNRAKGAIRKFDFSILVEGQMDLLMSHQAGYHNTVASSGTALTVGHVSRLKRLSENLLIIYDSDRAGLSASERAFTLALSMGMNVKIGKLPSGSDPADLIHKDFPQWKKTIANASHIVSFVWNNILEEKLEREKFVSQFKKKVIPLLRALQSDAEKSRLISDLKMTIATGIREDHLWEEIKKKEEKEESARDFEENVHVSENSSNTSASSLERKILAVLYWQNEKEKSLLNLSKVRARLKEIFGKESISSLEKIFEKEKDKMIFEAETIYEGSSNLEKDMEELLLNLERDTVKKKFEEKMRELYTAEREKDSERVIKLLKECQEMTAKLEFLKKAGG